MIFPTEKNTFLFASHVSFAILAIFWKFQILVLVHMVFLERYFSLIWLFCDQQSEALRICHREERIARVCPSVLCLHLGHVYSVRIFPKAS
jgi:hypothetical protein